jgi:RNA polymerase sigma-B factor
VTGPERSGAVAARRRRFASGPPGGDDDTLALIERYQATGDRRLRNDVVERHRGLAERVARRYQGRGLALDDLRQTALLAMVRAVDRFDPAFGASFATFVGRTIDGEMKRALRDRAWTVRPPRGVQERHLLMRKRHEELTHRLGREPTLQELASALDLAVDEVLDAIEAGAARNGAGLTRVDDAGEEVDADVALAVHEVGFERADDRVIVDRLLERLDDRQRQILVLRFYEGLDQATIGQRLGVSQSYLSRLLRRALDELREPVPTGGELPSA